ncbi:hypothetical protein Taro_030236 [Colocasia esculenta]|uniref:Lipocalin/cytosolic fatty-acid binding domain-containing protein n=2 Tax=Mesangiospermae TaxID=1437183 RepID=A0A843VXB4_COLES|nr:hypothetical protein [Colocasia esculenta]
MRVVRPRASLCTGPTPGICQQSPPHGTVPMSVWLFAPRDGVADTKRDASSPSPAPCPATRHARPLAFACKHVPPKSVPTRTRAHGSPPPTSPSLLHPLIPYKNPRTRRRFRPTDQHLPSFWFSMAAAAAKKEMAVVRGLDLERYMGRWYEIASFPSWFQPRDGVDTRATYALQPGGGGGGATVQVLNETWSGGKRVSIEGTAYKADPASDEAKLKVKFYVPPFLPIIPVVGDYWVLYVDAAYQYAIVGEPRRQSLWILCRQTHMDEEVYNQLVEKAKEEGYDVTKLHKTPQSDPPPPDVEEQMKSKVDKGGWWIKSLFGK